MLQALAEAGAEATWLATDAQPGPELAGLIRLWSGPTGKDVAEQAEAVTTEGLSELQRSLKEGVSRPVVWVTRGAVAAGAEDVPALWQAPLWGLARSARSEHPELGPRLVDVGAGELDVRTIITALAMADEPELAIR